MIGLTTLHFLDLASCKKCLNIKRHQDGRGIWPMTSNRREIFLIFPNGWKACGKPMITNEGITLLDNLDFGQIFMKSFY